jgi:hypothetical protein
MPNIMRGINSVANLKYHADTNTGEILEDFNDFQRIAFPLRVRFILYDFNQTIERAFSEKKNLSGFVTMLLLF